MEYGSGGAELEARRLVVILVTLIVTLTKILTVWMERKEWVEGICIRLTEFFSEYLLCCEYMLDTVRYGGKLERRYLCPQV